MKTLPILSLSLVLGGCAGKSFVFSPDYEDQQAYAQRLTIVMFDSGTHTIETWSDSGKRTDTKEEVFWRELCSELKDDFKLSEHFFSVTCFSQPHSDALVERSVETETRRGTVRLPPEGKMWYFDGEPRPLILFVDKLEVLDTALVEGDKVKPVQDISGWFSWWDNSKGALVAYNRYETRKKGRKGKLDLERLSWEIVTWGTQDFPFEVSK